jgi:hypothetical protein
METGLEAQHSEELEGKISFRLKPGKSLDEFCERNFDNYDRDRFEAVAIRFFFAQEMIITVYALDKARQEGTNFNFDKIPVKKFKMNRVSFPEFTAFVNEFNFTLTAGNFSIEDIEVINK